MFALLGHHFEAGGWAMWLILFWLVCTLGLITERLLYLLGAHQDPDAFTATVLKGIASRDFYQSIAISKSARTPLGRIVQAGLGQAMQPPKKMQAAMDEAALREMPKLTRNMNLLTFFANLAMLSGLFGTIVGLIKAFGAVGGPSIDPSAKARILAEGIAEAMNCTAFGLLSAIVALVGYAVINGWIQNIEDSIHLETVRVYNAIKQARREYPHP